MLFALMYINIIIMFSISARSLETGEVIKGVEASSLLSLPPSRGKEATASLLPSSSSKEATSSSLPPSRRKEATSPPLPPPSRNKEASQLPPLSQQLPYSTDDQRQMMMSPSLPLQQQPQQQHQPQQQPQPQYSGSTVIIRKVSIKSYIV